MEKNIVIKNSKWKQKDLSIIFGDFNNNVEPYEIIDSDSLEDLMVKTAIYPSKTKARTDKRIGEIPRGYTEFKANKKNRLYIWNPKYE